MQLLWLLVRFRIEFKFFFKILYGLAPSYLSYLISRWRPSRYNLRNSKDNLLLSYPSFISKLTLGDRSFTCALQGCGMLCHSMSDAPSQSVDVFTVPLATPRVLPWQPTICHTLRKLFRISARKQKGLNIERFTSKSSKKKQTNGK